MHRWTLQIRSLRHYRRTQLSVLAGLAISATVVVGALVVGDSVRYSLETMANQRVGRAQFAWVGSDRFFRDALAADLHAELAVATAPMIIAQGSVASAAGAGRVNHAQVLGVDDRFFALALDPSQSVPLDESAGVYLNRRMQRDLAVEPGDTVVLRVAKPSALPMDAPLSTDDEQTVALRLTVIGVVEDAAYGRFSLQAGQVPPHTLFVPLPLLQQRLDVEGRANVLLFGQGEGATIDTASVTAALRKHWTLADAELNVVEVEGQDRIEIRSHRVFLDPPVEAAAVSIDAEPEPALSYFVNELAAGTRGTPYSVITALPESSLRPLGFEAEGAFPSNGMIVSDWLANDLDVQPGDDVAIRYFVMGSMRRLEERSASFRVVGITPMRGAAADPTWMPDFPGLRDSENCADWDPGFPLDLDRIRDVDEAYWDAHRGTPKAFILLAQGQGMWSNRFGDLTTVRYPAAETTAEDLSRALLDRLDPESLGFHVMAIRDEAHASTVDAMDFGGLFLSFSFFLIVAALLLAGMLFVFGVEQRAAEIGTLLAVGYTPGQVRRMFLREGIVLSVVGSGIGVVLGTWYTRFLVDGLNTVWRDAIGETALQYAAAPASLAMGGAASLLIGVGAIAVTVRGQARQPVRALLSGESPRATEASRSVLRRKWTETGAALSLIGALALVLGTMFGSGEDRAPAFFGSGALLLVGGLLAWSAVLNRLALTPGTDDPGMGLLTLRGLTRRRGRSLATVALLACGSYLVVSVGANRLDALKSAEKMSSGTGGFALVSETAVPVLRDLNDPAAREVYGLDEAVFSAVKVVPMRVRIGDDASCLNLNRAQTPRLLGVNAGDMSGRFTFATTAKDFAGSADDPWRILEAPAEDGAIPAIADNNSILWAMGKKVGDRVTYHDERGQAFDVILAGGLANSILQGSIVISEAAFTEKFPSQSGYRMFLIDAPASAVPEVSAELGRALRDAGAESRPAFLRLAEFNAIQNTYLSIFQILGGLGMLVGSVGLGVVVLRNVLERRAELGVFRALGFTRRAVTGMVIREHALLLTAGLGCGLVAAVLSVAPVLASPGADVPYASLAVTVLAIFANGFLWTAAAASLALRGELLGALRNE